MQGRARKYELMFTTAGSISVDAQSLEEANAVARLMLMV